MTREEFIRRWFSNLQRDGLMEWIADRAIFALGCGCLVVALLMFGRYAHGATVPSYTVSLYKSTTKVKDISADTEAAAFAACFDQAKVLQASTTSKVVCKTPVLSLVTVPDPVVTPPPPPPPMSASLSWTWVDPPPPDLANIRIDYGLAYQGKCFVDAFDRSVPLSDLTITKYLLTENLGPGQWCYILRGQNSSGYDVDLSNVVSKTL